MLANITALLLLEIISRAEIMSLIFQTHIHVNAALQKYSIFIYVQLLKLHMFTGTD